MLPPCWSGRTRRHGRRRKGAARHPALGPDAADTFIYIRAYPSKEERDRRLKAARSDPEFDQVVLQQERDPNARLIVKAHNIDMTPSGTYTAITVVP